MSSALNILELAYSYIEDERHWCQHFAYNGVRRCSSGAVHMNASNSEHAMHAVRMLHDCVPRGFAPNPREKSLIVAYNDTHNHAQVLRWWRLTIATAKAGGKDARAQQRRIRQQVIAMRKLYAIMQRLGRVKELSELYPPEEAHLWLYSPHKRLAGQRPADLIQAGKTEDVLRIIAQLKDGAFV